MTEEQYNLLAQHASDLRSAINAYEEVYGIIDLKADPIAEIVAAGARLIHVVDSVEPFRSVQTGEPF